MFEESATLEQTSVFFAAVTVRVWLILKRNLADDCFGMFDAPFDLKLQHVLAIAFRGFDTRGTCPGEMPPAVGSASL